MLQAVEPLYGLPEQVRFCRRCVISNQRPCSTPEFRNTPARKIQTIHIDDEGICDACRYAEQKESIDWGKREEELLNLLDRHRSPDGSHDCIVPGSGGKDSIYAAHVLKYRYGMNPLTVTWSPHLYTEIGWKNFQNWLGVGGFDNLTMTPNGKVHRLLTRLALENLFHPFQPFVLGQKNVAPKLALKYGIPLVFYGENEAEYGNPIADTSTSLRSNSFHAVDDKRAVWLGGVSLQELVDRHGLSRGDLEPYLPPSDAELRSATVEVHYLGYYLKWTPQEAYYYAVEHADFEANPARTEGTYSKYNSLDDKMDGLHYYTTLIKFGLGRASYDAAQEIRNKHLSRAEGVALVHRFDQEVPSRYFDELMDYMDLESGHFFELCDRFRPSHLWRREGREWRLRQRVE